MRTRTITRTTMMADITIADAGGGGFLLPLLSWFSLGFPVGAFACSHGLEAAIAQGRVGSAAEVGDWIETLLLSGSGWNDLVLLSLALRGEGDPAELDELAEALAGSAERREETRALGAAFATAARPWGGTGQAASYPLAAADAARACSLAAGPVILAYAHAFAASLVSAAVRLVPLGQSEAVALQRRLEPTILMAADRAAKAGLDDLGSCAILSEIAAMRHETLATRLFRS